MAKNEKGELRECLYYAFDNLYRIKNIAIFVQANTDHMELKYFKASDLDRNIKCTVHKSGKLGFTDAAIKKLDIVTNRFIKIGTTSDGKGGNDLYMSLQKESDEYCFKASKAGAYYYISTKPLFDILEIDYTKTTVMFDIVETEIDGLTVYKLKRRDKAKKIIK